MGVFLIKALQFILAISLLVLLHELGHFFFAKLFKVRVTRFYLFFNPKFHLISTYDTWVRRLFKMKPAVVPVKEKEEEGKKIKEKEYVGTEYGIGWLPLGGYCAIDGMIDETNQKLSEETHPWEFRTKPAWQRLLIMIGGVLVNFLLALFIYAMVLFTWGETYVPAQKMAQGMEFSEQAKALGFQDHDILLSTDDGDFKTYGGDMFRQIANAKQVNVMRDGQKVTLSLSGDLSLLDMIKSTPPFVRMYTPAVIDSILPGTPAAKIALQKGDSIVGVNGKAIASFGQFQDELSRVSDVVEAASSDAEKLKARDITIVVKRDTLLDTIPVTLNEELKLGFAPPMLYKPETHEYGFFESFPAGIKYGIHTLSSYVGDMKYVFTAEGAKSLGGFGAIGSLFPASWDWHQFWLMTAFLSIILAFMNILPIPALDGGHVLFLLFEMLTGRKPSEKFMIRAEYIGFGILLLLMIVANLNDILRWLGYM